MRRCDHSHWSDFRSTLRRLIALLAVALVASGLTWAAEFQLSTGNDSLTSNPIEDDLYTFSFSFSFMHNNLRFTAWENAFTDRSNDLRFDESYFSVSRSLGKIGGFTSEAEIGLVYVGEGLLGEGAQNAVHELLRSNPINGSQRVSIVDVGEGHRHHPIRGLDLDFVHDVIPLGVQTLDPGKHGTGIR